jgi:hypothetical protein
MSRLDTKQAFITHLLANLPSGITADDVAFENQNPSFNPEGKNLWLDTHYQEASNDPTGKTSASSDEQRGFFQIDVNTPLSNSNYDNELLSTIDELASTFSYGTTIVYNTQSVDLLENTSPNSAENGAWYRRFITINYLTFSPRN